MGWGLLQEPDTNVVPPNPTKDRVTEWGNAYPCLRMKQNAGNYRYQCPGMMQPAKRCRRVEGRLWRKFTCDRCGRTASDWKVQ